jgi:hypothetical protein
MPFDQTWLNGGAIALVTGTATWLGGIWFKSREQSDARQGREEHTQLELIKHRDQLMLEMIDTARQSLSIAHARINLLESRISELLEHISHMLSANTDDDRRKAEIEARRFINRMHRITPDGGNGAWTSQSC